MEENKKAVILLPNWLKAHSMVALRLSEILKRHREFKVVNFVLLSEDGTLAPATLSRCDELHMISDIPKYKIDEEGIYRWSSIVIIHPVALDDVSDDPEIPFAELTRVLINDPTGPVAKGFDQVEGANAFEKAQTIFSGKPFSDDNVIAELIRLGH